MLERTKLGFLFAVAGFLMTAGSVLIDQVSRIFGYALVCFGFLVIIYIFVKMVRHWGDLFADRQEIGGGSGRDLLLTYQPLEDTSEGEEVGIFGKLHAHWKYEITSGAFWFGKTSLRFKFILEATDQDGKTFISDVKGEGPYDGHVGYTVYRGINRNVLGAWTGILLVERSGEGPLSICFLTECTRDRGAFLMGYCLLDRRSR